MRIDTVWWRIEASIQVRNPGPVAHRESQFIT
jgi:hypothetical protein